MSKYSDQQVRDAVSSSTSIRGVLNELGLRPAGGNYATIHKKIQSLGIDTSHLLGQGHLKGKKCPWRVRPLENILKKDKTENTWRLKFRLIREGIKEEKCEKCRLTEWNKSVIPLELHHIDGDRTNNKLENLQMLCPNCHAQTENYRGKNKGRMAERQTLGA